MEQRWLNCGNIHKCLLHLPVRRYTILALAPHRTENRGFRAAELQPVQTSWRSEFSGAWRSLQRERGHLWPHTTVASTGVSPEAAGRGCGDPPTGRGGTGAERRGRPSLVLESSYVRLSHLGSVKTNGIINSSAVLLPRTENASAELELPQNILLERTPLPSVTQPFVFPFNLLFGLIGLLEGRAATC